MSKKYSKILVMMALCTYASAQTSPNFTQYIFNKFYYNPAAAGTGNQSQIQASLRSQYTGYLSDSDPGGGNTVSVFSADLPIQKIKGGLGVYFSSNQFSKIENKQEISLNYAYHKKINSNLISAGFGVGINNLRLFGENYRPRDDEDPIIPNTTVNLKALSFNTGIFLQNPSYQIGLSAKNLIKPSYQVGDGTISENPTLLLFGKYDLGVSYTLDISPTFLIKSDFIKYNTELGVITTYNQKYWGGVNYRWQDAVSVMLGGNFLKNMVKIGYSIDFVNFGTTAKSTTSHEIFLRYALASPKFGKKTIIKTPRYNF